ncbi:MAG TPA: YdcF family protein [Burkholderiales bacterium]|nr:YdcF family protein [Burkholderiales bacterium]
MLLVRKILTALLLPPTGPLLLLLLGLFLTHKWRRFGLALAWIATLSLVLLSLPLVSQSLRGLLYDPPPLDYAAAHKAQAIVILGGGKRLQAPEYDGADTVNSFSLERIRYGAWVAKRVDLPLLVSGGIVFRGTAEALVMRDVLEKEFGIKVRWVEPDSKTTHENARRSMQILQTEGIRTIVLVTHALHMQRAIAEFEAVGFTVIPAPTVLPNPEVKREPFVFWLIPSSSALRESSYVLHELLGDLARRMGL